MGLSGVTRLDQHWEQVTDKGEVGHRHFHIHLYFSGKQWGVGRCVAIGRKAANAKKPLNSKVMASKNMVEFKSDPGCMDDLEKSVGNGDIFLSGSCGGCALCATSTIITQTKMSQLGAKVNMVSKKNLVD